MSTVTELPKSGDTLFGPLVAKINQGAMVAWINARLPERAGHDVRKSIVFYDADRTFETAMLPSEWQALKDADKLDTFLQLLHDSTPVRFYSKGLK